MRHLLFAILLVLPLLAGAQTQKDYEHALASFQDLYNRDQAAAINEMWPVSIRRKIPVPLWDDNKQASLKQQYGKFLSFKYAGIDENDHDKVRLFYVKFEKSTHMLSMTLDKDRMLGDFRLQTSNKYIDEVFKKMQQGR